MARVMKIFTVVRNHWKKTVVGIAALSYGANYMRNKFRWVMISSVFSLG